MATRFELLLEGSEQAYLQSAGEEAIAEIERLHAHLSFFRASSAVGRINARAAVEPVRVDPEVFRLLLRAGRMHVLTGGAFDITVGPLMRCWGFALGAGSLPEPEALEETRGVVGMELILLDEEAHTVRFARPGVLIDLGAIGKGYALEQAAHVLRELGVTSALLHGGTSTVEAIGSQPAGDPWKVAIAYPGEAGGGEQLLAVVALEDEALSVSAVWGRSFEADGQVYGHVLDPRSGRPAMGAALAAVICSSATEADALSTALLTLGPDEHQVVTTARSDLPFLVLGHLAAGSGYRVVSRGIRIEPSAGHSSVEVVP
jgi:FAD:protein FMN transferase